MYIVPSCTPGERGKRPLQECQIINAEPTVMIDGQVHSLTDLTGIEPGKAIEITAQAMHPVSGEFFDKWLVIGTAPAGGRQRGNAYVFTMPRHPVKIQAIYPSPAHWANPAVQYQNLLHDNKAIDAVTPYITEAAIIGY